MKKIEKDYQEVLEDSERCKFFGNVWIGTNGGLSVEKLKELYSGVVFSYGATSERKLGLPNEYDLKGVLSSRKMANWYNGSLDTEPDFSKTLSLDQVKNVAIIGNGNVAMDISRILLKDPSSIAPYDIPSSVIDDLKASSIQNIQMIARRGVVQSAFTIKELREVSHIPNVKLFVMRDEFDRSMNEASLLEMGAGFSINSRAAKRKTDFMQKEACTFLENEEQLKDLVETKTSYKKLIFRYLWNPYELIGDD